jgi:transposase InsO family protein
LRVDATPYAWFARSQAPDTSKGDKRRYALCEAIDDATRRITGLYMCKNECLHGYFEMLRRTIKNHGMPVSVYADRHTIFRSPNKAKAEIDPKVNVSDTQFGGCLKELGVVLIAARSPQAKGRIERLWGTLQGRLPTEFAIRNITTIDAGGVFSYGRKSFKVVETVSSGCIPLTMIRLIQHKVLKRRGESALNEDDWKAGVTAGRIKKALNGFMADAPPGGYYRFTEPNDDMKLILDSLGIDADLRLPTISELRKLKYSFDEATFM